MVHGSKASGQAAPIIQAAPSSFAAVLEVEVLKSCTELFAWYFLPPRTGSSSEAQEGAALGRIPA